MEEYLAELKPVSEWEFRLWKVVWKNIRTKQTKTLWCVSTETHLDEECQRRWPGDYWDEYQEYDIAKAQRPHQIGSIHGCRIDQDPWTAGDEMRIKLGLR
jgi:hypothetical protein